MNDVDKLELMLQAGVRPETRRATAYRTTAVMTAASAHELRATVARSMPHLQWRHHGIGVLQAYLVEDASKEVRVHVWHPSLVADGIESSGQIHNHRFHLRSTVLLGEIEHEEFHLRPDEDAGDWQRWTVFHARDPRNQNRPAPVAGFYRAERITGVIGAAQTYLFSRGAFHRSRVADWCVSLVTKHDQRDEPAMILAPRGTTPLHGFLVARPEVDVAGVVREAAERLLQAAR